MCGRCGTRISMRYPVYTNGPWARQSTHVIRIEVAPNTDSQRFDCYSDCLAVVCRLSFLDRDGSFLIAAGYGVACSKRMFNSESV